jgi:LemA protein
MRASSQARASDIIGRARVSGIISRAYGKRYSLKADEVVVPSRFSKYELARSGMSIKSLILSPLKKMKPTYNAALIMAVISTILLLKTAVAVYYYNNLIDTQQNMLASSGDVHALMQRRNDIANNLSQAVLDYSKHEKGVFTAIVSLRKFFTENSQTTTENLKQVQEYYKNMGSGEATGSTGSTSNTALSGATGGNMMAALSKLVAVSEQYPDLKLSTNFGTLMTALIQVEQDLATQRIKFNEQANIYTTVMAKFPGNFFAWIFRFKSMDYFEANEEAKSFKVIGY